ncbi:MAG: homogentisate 1,2-dioxygenase [Myxococcales bacterium]|nr:homogentisate 1,2-dioxygenase [Myxococcales bacterium]
MFAYATRGQLPAKPHTVFRQPDGSLYHEHCFTQVGFDGPFSILYHRNPPQDHGGAKALQPVFPGRKSADDASNAALRRRHLRSGQLHHGGSALTGRVPLMFNKDLTIGFVRPTEDDARYFINADADDVFYCHMGGGEMRSWFGTLRFGPGDYIIVPRSTLHRFVLDRDSNGAAIPQDWLWTACRTGLRVPSQYRNSVGQLRMDAPYTPRDLRLPTLPAGDVAIDPDGPRNADGSTTVVTKRADRFSEHAWRHSPLDTIGWDGTVYPFAFPILNFQAKAGAVHLPPTVHGTFATGGSLICSFVPRTVDFGPDAIPCPYPHSNVDVDEFIFYCDGDFTSRRGIDAGSMTYHPAGVPHGPHPGAYEGSIGVREVGELAVMIDTFDPLVFTPQGAAIEAPDYDESWWASPTQPGESE